MYKIKNKLQIILISKKIPNNFYIVSEGLKKCGSAIHNGNAPRYVLQTKGHLVTFCTMIIFQSSVKHSAINNLQWDYGSFAPVSPLCMRGDLPTEADRGKITQQILIKSLPGPKLCIRSAGIAYALTQFTDDDVFLLLSTPIEKTKKGLRSRSLGDIKLKLKRIDTVVSKYDLDIDDGKFPPRWLFNEEEVKVAFLGFQIKLQEIENEINERNEKLKQSGDVPYDVLLPSKIPCGIAI